MYARIATFESDPGNDPGGTERTSVEFYEVPVQTVT
jgi:hypothetical protein